MDKVERGNIGGYTKYEADVFIEAWYGACFKYPNHFCQHETKEMKWQHLFYFCTRRENGVLPIAARISHGNGVLPMAARISHDEEP
ncbi:hypothetical protein MAR_032062 [Mya arenaria]|nr:hypothetical protein MAR_032062 [Mya arenaria]